MSNAVLDVGAQVPRRAGSRPDYEEGPAEFRGWGGLGSDPGNADPDEGEESPRVSGEPLSEQGDGFRSLTITGASSSRSVVREVNRLRQEIGRYQAAQARRAGWERRFVPTGLMPLDARLPHGGLPCGAITEILADQPGVGAMSLAMRIARQLSSCDCRLSIDADPGMPNDSLRPFVPEPALSGADDSLRPLVLIDSQGDFYPPAAWPHGIDFEQLIVVRPRNARDAYWAADQALRCGAVAAVIAPLGMLNDQLARRLQLAAESSGCVGVILRTGSRPTHRFAAVRMRMEALPIVDYRLSIGQNLNALQSTIANRQSTISMTLSRLCRLTLLTVREGSPAEPFVVDWDHETGPGFVSAVPGDRTARTG